MSDAILSARELHKSYDLGRRKVEVLHGVSLEIANGDFLSLQGASGAGKSTLLHLLGGLPEFDALENVLIPARIAHTSVAIAERRGRELLERVGLAKRMNHLPTELSGGEQQRVALARALINQPRILFADEPTGNLDSKTGGEVLDLLCELQREAKLTMIIATHDGRKATASSPRFRRPCSRGGRFCP